MGMIYINRNRQSLGQFDEHDVADGLKRGKFLPDDLAWQEPMESWKPLAEFTSLPAPSAQAEEPPQGLPEHVIEPEMLPAAPLPSRQPDGMLDIGKCLEAGWNCFAIHWANLVLGTLIMLALSVAPQMPFQMAKVVFEMFKKTEKSEPWLLVAGGGVLLFFWVLAMAASALIKGGYVYFLLRALRGAPSMSDLFAGFKGSTCLQLVLGMLVSIIFIIVGFCCFIFPGIYLAVAFCYVPILIIDRKMEFWEAMQLSRRTVHAQWFPVFGLAILSWIAMVLGLLLCCVGMLGTIPIGTMWLMEGYRQLFGDSAEDPSAKM